MCLVWSHYHLKSNFAIKCNNKKSIFWIEFDRLNCLFSLIINFCDVILLPLSHNTLCRERKYCKFCDQFFFFYFFQTCIRFRATSTFWSNDFNLFSNPINVAIVGLHWTMFSFFFYSSLLFAIHYIVGRKKNCSVLFIVFLFYFALCVWRAPTIHNESHSPFWPFWFHTQRLIWISWEIETNKLLWNE